MAEWYVKVWIDHNLFSDSLLMHLELCPVFILLKQIKLK